MSYITFTIAKIRREEFTTKHFLISPCTMYPLDSFENRNIEFSVGNDFALSNRSGVCDVLSQNDFLFLSFLCVEESGSKSETFLLDPGKLIKNRRICFFTSSTFSFSFVNVRCFVNKIVIK